MKLYIMRHGIAVDRSDSPDHPDDERRLTPEGIWKIEKTIKWITAFDFTPETLCTSPYRRACETAEIIKKNLRYPVEIKKCSFLQPGTSPSVIVNNLKKYSEQTVCIIGHQPDCSLLASYCLTKKGSLAIEFKKAGVCCILFATTIEKGTGTLAWLFQPRMA